MRRTSAILVLVVTGLVTGCATTSTQGPAAPGTSASSAPDPSTMQGTLALSYGKNVTATGIANYTGGNVEGAPCAGENGFVDITPNAQVTVSDAADKVVGISNLGNGTTGPDPAGTGLVCLFTFTVPDLPKAAFYKVEVSHRGQVTYPRAQISDVGLTLGSS